MDFYALDHSERQGWLERTTEETSQPPSPPAFIPSLLPISTAELLESTSYLPTLSPIASCESIALTDRQSSATSRPDSRGDPGSTPNSSRETHAVQRSSPDRDGVEGDRKEWRLSYEPEAYASRLFSPYVPKQVPASQPQTPQPPPHNTTVAPAATQQQPPPPHLHSPAPADSSHSDNTPHHSVPTAPSTRQPLTQPAAPLLTTPALHSPPAQPATLDAGAEILRKYKHSWLGVSDTMDDIKRLLLGAEKTTEDSPPASGAAGGVGGTPSNLGPDRSSSPLPPPSSMEGVLREHAQTTYPHNAGLGTPIPRHANETLPQQMVNPRDAYFSEDTSSRSILEQLPANVPAPSSQTLASRAHLQPPILTMAPRSQSVGDLASFQGWQENEGYHTVGSPQSDVSSPSMASGWSSEADMGPFGSVSRSQRISDPSGRQRVSHHSSGNELEGGGPSERPFLSPLIAPADNARFSDAPTFSPSRLSTEGNNRRGDRRSEVSETSSPRQQRASETARTNSDEKGQGNGNVGKWDSLSVHWTSLSKNKRPNAYLCIQVAMPEPILTVFTQGALTWDQHQRTTLGLSVRLSGPPVLPQGDDYEGGWKDGLPSGEGKYMWADGSCYMGSWVDGTPDGPGIYSWASGAFYEGTWKQGCMEGEGTYSDGYIGTFTGFWHDHKMHGFGSIQYTAGDRYEGLLVDGQLNGTGLYTWADGCRYNGMFALGQRDGRGTFVTQGNEMFFGEFVEGYEHGRGVYTLPDFSFFDGVWVDGVRHGVGVSFPPPDKDAQVNITAYMHGRKMRAEAASETFLLTYELPPMHQSRHAHRVSSSLKKDALLDYLGFDRSNSFGKGVGRNMSSSSSVGRENSLGKGVGRNMSGAVARERSLAAEVQNFVTSTNEATAADELARQTSAGGSTINCNKMGETVYMGTASYNLMLNLQVGINCVVSKVNQEPLRACNAADFEDEEGSGTLFPRLGSEKTPPHPSTEFHFKDFCPMVFRNLREKAGISVGDYVQWLCGDAALREMSSPGKSGAGFFISNNDKLLIKTLTKEEFATLHALLPKLYQHMMQHPNSMLCQFYGVYRMVLHNGEKVRMMVMKNILCTTAPLHRRFDLKGSTQGRYTKKTLKELKPTSILKDLDLDLMFQLPAKWLDSFNEQLHADCLFLEAMGLIDYSMLVGIHFRDAKKSPNLLKSLGNKFMVQELEDPFEQYSKITTSLDRLMQLSNAPSDQHSAMPTGGPMGVRSSNDEGEVADALNFRPWVQRDRRASMQGIQIAQSKARDEFFSRVGSETKLTTEQLAEARGEETRLGIAMVSTVTPGRVFAWPEDASVTRPPTLKDPHEAVIYFGIIDFLQEYNMRKRLEHQGKAMLYLNKSSISVTNPAAYGTRFRSFMSKLFQAARKNSKEVERRGSALLSPYSSKGVALRDIM